MCEKIDSVHSLTPYRTIFNITWSSCFLFDFITLSYGCRGILAHSSSLQCFSSCRFACFCFCTTLFTSYCSILISWSLDSDWTITTLCLFQPLCCWLAAVFEIIVLLHHAQFGPSFHRQTDVLIFDSEILCSKRDSMAARRPGPVAAKQAQTPPPRPPDSWYKVFVLIYCLILEENF